MLNTASISSQSDYIISELIKFMEKEECPTDYEGKCISSLLRDYLSTSPNMSQNILKEIMYVYSDRINRLCEQYEE